jgi:hypothetical protein
MQGNERYVAERGTNWFERFELSQKEEQMRERMHEEIRKYQEQQKKVQPLTPRVTFVGYKSTGKSALVNALYGTKCRVSSIDCCRAATVVHSTDTNDVVDIYGYDDERPYYTKEEIDNPKQQCSSTQPSSNVANALTSCSSLLV